MYMLAAMAGCLFAYYFLLYNDYLISFMLVCLNRLSQIDLLEADFSYLQYFELSEYYIFWGGANTTSA